MGKSGVLWLLAVALAASSMTVATGGESTPPAAGEASVPAAARSADFGVLKGAWVRPDGGYTIVIKNVGPNGALEATYYNPNQLPFATAQASREGMTLRASFELTAGGYAGSTYELTYDPASDRLKGTYYQAVAKQKYEIWFARK